MISAHPKTRHSKAARVGTLTFFGMSPPILSSPTDDPPSCPDCLTPLSTEYLASLPPGYTLSNRKRFPQVPPPEC